VSYPTLTRGEVRKVAKIMREQGAILPKHGWSWTFGPVSRRALQAAGFKDSRGEGPASIKRDAGGLYFTWY
jgi:hypothetical protein